MSLHDRIWPEGRFWVLLTPAKRIARKGGAMAIFDNYEDACAALKPGYAVGALDVLSASVVCLMEKQA